jgi:hypothetical protein
MLKEIVCPFDTPNAWIATDGLEVDPAELVATIR